MTWIDHRSLWRTIERIEEHAASEASPRLLASEAVDWVLSRQVMAGRRRGMFQPLPADFAEGVRLPTGEKLKTKLATWNVLGHEAVRALHLLAPEDAQVKQAVARALSTFRQDCYAQQHCAIGECAHSGISYMRLLLSSGTSEEQVWIEAELEMLRSHRLSTGRWRQFPFYYTLHVLLELPGDAARDELNHAVPACLHVRDRIDPPQSVTARRSDIVERVLALSDSALLRD